MSDPEDPGLYIPADLEERGSYMKTAIVQYAAQLCEAIDYMMEMSGACEAPTKGIVGVAECPRETFEALSVSSLDLWVFTHHVLDGDQTDASLMKAFMEQKAHVLQR